MDGQPLRTQVQSSSWTLKPDPTGDHTVTICKATEGIGWMEFAGVFGMSCFHLLTYPIERSSVSVIRSPAGLGMMSAVFPVGRASGSIRVMRG